MFMGEEKEERRRRRGGGERVGEGEEGLVWREEGRKTRRKGEDRVERWCYYSAVVMI